MPWLGARGIDDGRLGYEFADEADAATDLILHGRTRRRRTAAGGVSR